MPRATSPRPRWTGTPRSPTCWSTAPTSSSPSTCPATGPREAWEHALDFLVTPKARRGFVSGPLPELTYAATDVDWSHGSGQVVSGPAAALGLAICGRTVALGDLDGPGADRLAAWARG